jgi:hypothetical protein
MLPSLQATDCHALLLRRHDIQDAANEWFLQSLGKLHLTCGNQQKLVLETEQNSNWSTACLIPASIDPTLALICNSVLQLQPATADLLEYSE